MIFGNAISFSVSGNFRPDFGIGFMHQRHEIRCSQFADVAARDFCLTIANHLDARQRKSAAAPATAATIVGRLGKTALTGFLCPSTLTALPLTTRR